MNSTVKTHIDLKEIRMILSGKFTNNYNELNYIKGGEHSKVFSFCVGKEQYIIRVNKELKPFQKDFYAFTHFSKYGIPIPKIVNIDKWNNDLYFCISCKANGHILDNLSKKQFHSIFLNLLIILDKIHNIPIKKYQKYGEWNNTGKANSISWKKYILSINKDNYYQIDKMIKYSFLEKEVFETIYEVVNRLIQFCPEEQTLVHDDFGFNNVLAKGLKITGVIDWAKSKYGDHIYDLAWLDFWPSQINYLNTYRKHIRVDLIPFFYERLICYELYIGLCGLAFFARSFQRGKYERTKKKLMSLIEYHKYFRFND